MEKRIKLVAGPMATISHRPFRNLLESFGCADEYFTEMINAGSLLANSHLEEAYIDPAPCPEKLVWQLTGYNPENMPKAAEILMKLPGLGLDLNMGCSAPDIYRTGAGIGWMIKPMEETQAMVHSVKEVVDRINETLESEDKKRFSVKLRLGDDDFTDEKFFAFTDMLVSEGVELLTLHPRTKKERLTISPRYHYAEDLKKRYGNEISVYVNGNVTDEISLKKALNACPSVDGVMISRACVQKPWIFRELSKITSDDGVAVQGPIEINMKDMAFRFIDDVLKFQPEEFWKTRLQRFFTYYPMNFQFSHYAQTQFLNAKNADDLKLRIEEFFVKCPDELIKIV